MGGGPKEGTTTVAMPHKLKDLARLALRFTSCSHMAHALAEGPQGAGIEVLTLKNK